MPETVRRTRRSVDRVTIADVAAAAGVSTMTVSRVLNDQPGMSAPVRAAVQRAVETLRYTRNHAARSLAAAEVARIGVLYDRPNGAYLSELLIGLLDEASRSGHQLLLQRCESPALVTRSVDTLLGEGVDGVVVSPPLSDLDQVYERLAEAGKPAVGVAGRRRDGGPTVCIDDSAAARAMTEHLLGLGHRRIGFVAGDRAQAASRARERGYRDAMAAAGLASGPIANGDFSYRSGIIAGGALLGATPRPSAIFASNDDMAAAVCNVAHRAGLEIPRDVTVVGFDDTIIATTTWPELTTVRQPVADLARAAVERLVALTRQGAADGENVLPHRLVRRESDGPPPA